MSTNSAAARSRSAIGAKSRMNVQAVAAAGAGLIVRLHGGIGVGDENHTLEIAADKRLERGTQLREFVRQILVQGLVAHRRR